MVSPNSDDPYYLGSIFWRGSPAFIITVDYCGLRRRGLLWIASSITVDCVVEDCCGLRRRFVDLDWTGLFCGGGPLWCLSCDTYACIMLSMRIALCVRHVLCCKFTMVSQPYCVWVLDKGVDVGL